MNGFQWNQIPDPNPLIQHGKYKELPKPTWQVKSIQPSVHSMPYNFKMKFENPSSESEGTLVFQSVQSSSLKEMQQYISYVLGQSLLPDFMKEETNTKNIKFDSYIESGNLHKVYEVYNGEYNLFMNADTNTKGQTRWFYFSVSNASKGQAIRFNICNFNKSVRLFKLGMKPVYLSQKESDENLWKPVSGNIEFYRNSNAIDISKKLYFYTLSFSHTFEHPDDTVFFALSIPYPYTKLLDYLSTLESKLLDPSKISYKREELCKSVGGLSVPKLIITAPKSQGLELYKRKAIVITCRVHPGETAGSCVMEGILEYLVSVSASELRGIYIFYIIPMLNPDGVVCGNSRCGLMGIDLNRRWDSPSDLAHPTIYHCKEMIKAISTKREILMFCDLHGHSKKMNSFIYGCNVAANGGFTSWTKVRLLPRVIAKRSSLFSYPDCRFIVKPDKQGTGRVVVWKEFSITNSFTLETSMFGYKIGDITVNFI
jgi:cytosolic carboxypeptidase protein 2/3